MNRKPLTAKILDKVLKTLPNLSDRDLERIVTACHGLMRIRVQAKQAMLQPKESHESH